MIDPDVLLRAREHLSIAHHIPGRIRLRFGAGILDAVPEFTAGDKPELLKGLAGIKDIRVNAAAFSLLVLYDPEQLLPGMWEQLIEGNESEAAQVVARLRELTGRHGPDPASPS